MTETGQRRCGTVIVSRGELWGQVLWANEDYCRLLEYTQQEILLRIKKDTVSFLEKDYAKTMQANIEKQLAEGDEAELKYCARTRTGKKVWQLAYGCKDTYEGKEALRLVVFDITDIHLADVRLKSINRRMHAIISNMPGGVFLYPTETEGTVSYISDGALEVFQCSREDFFHKFGGRADAFLYEGEKERIMLHANKKLRDGMIREFEYRIRTAKGEVRWTRARRQLFCDSDDTLTACVLLMDVDGAHRNQEELLRKTKEMNDLSNSIEGGIVRFLLDKRCTVLIANQGFYRMLGEEETTQKHDLESLFGKAALNELRKTIFGAKMMGDTIQATCSIPDEEGGEMWLNISGSIVEIGNGMPVVQAVISDITELKQNQKQLEYERERYRVLLSCMEDTVFEYNYEQDRITFISNRPNVRGDSRTIEIDNYEKRVRLLDIIYPEDIEKIAPLFQGKSFSHIDIRLRLENHPDGKEIPEAFQKKGKTENDEREYRWFEVHGTAICDENGRLYRNVGAIHDIDEKKRANELLRYKSERDPLTQIYNKTSVDANINEFFAQEGKDKTHALLVLDLDDFKSVNDTYGHQFGDKVLVKTTRVIKNLMRQTDIVGRVGGDEFVVLMKNIPDRTCMLNRAMDLCQKIESSSIREHKDFHLCASVGIAVYPEHGRDYESLFGKADMALYEAKRKGKNQYALYSEKSERVVVKQKAQGVKTRCYRTEYTGSAFEILNGLVEVGLKNRSVSVSDYLEFLGEQMDASRCYLVANDGIWREWCNADAKPYRDSKSLVEAKEYQAYLSLFSKENKMLVIKSREEISKKLPLFYQKLSENHVESTLQVQIPQGILGLDECTTPRDWTEHELGVMQFAAKLLSYCF